MDAFGVKGPNRHIINGHVPVHASKGENPIKANGKLMVIDGGFSKAYHNETGIAGYTLRCPTAACWWQTPTRARNCANR